MIFQMHRSTGKKNKTIDLGRKYVEDIEAFGVDSQSIATCIHTSGNVKVACSINLFHLMTSKTGRGDYEYAVTVLVNGVLARKMRATAAEIEQCSFYIITPLLPLMAQQGVYEVHVEENCLIPDQQCSSVSKYCVKYFYRLSTQCKMEELASTHNRLFDHIPALSWKLWSRDTQTLEVRQLNDKRGSIKSINGGEWKTTGFVKILDRDAITTTRATSSLEDVDNEKEPVLTRALKSKLQKETLLISEPLRLNEVTSQTASELIKGSPLPITREASLASTENIAASPISHEADPTNGTRFTDGDTSTDTMSAISDTSIDVCAAQMIVFKDKKRSSPTRDEYNTKKSEYWSLEIEVSKSKRRRYEHQRLQLEVEEEKVKAEIANLKYFEDEERLATSKRELEVVRARLPSSIFSHQDLRRKSSDQGIPKKRVSWNLSDDNLSMIKVRRPYSEKTPLLRHLQCPVLPLLHHFIIFQAPHRH
jgi:hypothetical protein